MRLRYFIHFHSAKNIHKSLLIERIFFCRKNFKILKEYFYVYRQIYIYNHFVETGTLHINYTELKIVQ